MALINVQVSGEITVEEWDNLYWKVGRAVSDFQADLTSDRFEELDVLLSGVGPVEVVEEAPSVDHTAHWNIVYPTD